MVLFSPRHDGRNALARCLAGILCLSLAACANGPAPGLGVDTRNMQWSVDRPVQRVQVVARAGLLTIVPGPELRADVRAEASAGDPHALDGLRFGPDAREAGVARLMVWTNNGPPPSLRIRLEVPEGLEVVVRGIRLDVDAEARIDNLIVQTSSGRVWVNDPIGAVSVLTGSGDVEVTGRYRTAEVETEHGEVRVDVLSDAEPGAVRIESKSGDVRIAGSDDSLSGLRYVTSSGHLRSERPTRFAVERTDDKQAVRTYRPRRWESQQVPRRAIVVRTRSGSLRIQPADAPEIGEGPEFSPLARVRSAPR